MKIKTKLTLNVVIVLIIIVAVAATSFVGMGFVKSRLLYLTQKSTPFQMRTVEFQRAIMGATADLIKVSSSRAQEDFAAFNSEAGKSIAEVKAAQEAIEQLSGGEIIETYNDMKKIADEILQVTAERLRAEAEAKAASLLINQRLQEMSVKLGDLDARIHALQLRSSKAFIGSVEDTSAISKQLRHLEILRANLKDLQIAFMDFHRSQEKRALIMSRSKVNTLFARIMQEDFLRESNKQAGDLQALASKAEELIKLRMTADADLKAVEILAKDVDERLSVLLITLEQDVMAAREKASLEGDRQSGLMGESNISANVLAMNSELIETGLSIEGLSTRLFTLFSEKDVAVVEAQLRKTFDKVPNAMAVLQKGLGRLGDKDSLRILKEAETSLDAIKNMLFVQDGVVAKIRKQLSMQEKAQAATGRLRVIVLKQAEKSRESVTAARGEQEKAIGTVNRMVRFSMTLIAVISLASIVFGIVFGIWVYRSISRPLSQLMKVADEVSNGNLAYVIPKSTADEIGVVQTSMTKMVGNLRGIVGKIAASTSLLASSSEELSSTATVIDKGSQEQTRQVEQSATAMTEMSQTTLDVAKNASSTAEDARKMKAVADQGRQAMEGTVSELVKFSETFKIAATRIEALSKKSQEINNVVSLIREIAEQTNLLALNAAIEAAHAGDQGRGFAVVADNVRQLAERTSLATDDIGKTIHAMQEDVDGTVALVKREKEAVGIVLEQVKATMQEIGGIVTNVEHVTDMIQRIAVATDEQSSTSDMVSHSMEGIANVTRQLNNSIEEIKRSAGDLSKLATELNSTAGWFKT